jgi:hypothetical protein
LDVSTIVPGAGWRAQEKTKKNFFNEKILQHAKIKRVCIFRMLISQQSVI